MINKTKKGFLLNTAFDTIYDKNKQITQLQEERDDLIAATLDQFEFDSYKEFESKYLEFSHNLT